MPQKKQSLRNQQLKKVQERTSELQKEYSVPRRLAMKLVGKENRGAKITQSLISKMLKDEEIKQKEKEKRKQESERLESMGYRKQGTYTEYLLEQILQEIKKRDS